MASKRFTFQEGWLILVLVMALAVTPAVAVRLADWVPGLWTLQLVSLTAVLAGFFLAKSRFRTGVALLMSIVYGLFVVGFFSGILLPAELGWHERIPQLVSRQVDWLIKASNVLLNPEAGDTSRDGLIFIMQTGLVLWIMGFAASWYTFRHLNIWWVILPSGILLLFTVINYYGPQPMGTTLIAFLLLALLYIVSSHYMVRERQWRRLRVVYNRETRLDFLQTGFLIALLATPVAWLVPDVSASSNLREISEPLDQGWQRIQDGWTQLFASMKSYGGEYSDPFGNSLALGGPRQIEPVPIMDVSANAGRYWRGTIYDQFTGDGWVSTAETKLIVSPDDPLEQPTYRARETITATVTSYLANSGLLYYPHQPERTDRQAKFTVFSPSETFDIVSSISRYVIYEGQTYKVWGTASTAVDDQLRLAGAQYPEWVQERYLQLPADFSPRIAQLAESLAGNLTTPYDQADVLTDWLRENMTYNEAVLAPPEDADPLEYFLFESQEGYCNYYASALAAMLRSLGVPARIVGGYARGAWQEDLGLFRVYSNNAHTWVEVFFPEYGWVEFEPTASQPSILRTAVDNPAGANETSETDLNLPEEGPDVSDPDDMLRQMLEEQNQGSLNSGLSNNLGLLIAGGVLLAALVIGGGILLAGRQRAGSLSAVAAIYDRMGGFARWLGVQLWPAQTPHERAAVLITAAPESAAPIDVITDLYVEERFSPLKEGTFDDRATTAWHELRPMLLRHSLLHALARLQRKPNPRKPRF